MNANKPPPSGMNPNKKNPRPGKNEVIARSVILGRVSASHPNINFEKAPTINISPKANPISNG